MKLKSQFITASSIAILALLTPHTVSARTKASASPSPSPAGSSAVTAPAAPASKTGASPAPAAATADRPIPYHGMISAVDAKAGTFSIAGKEKTRTFRITDKSKLTKAGAPATMKDVVANEEVRGSYWKKADGSLEAKSVKLGPLTEQEKAAEEGKKAKRAEKKKEKDAATSSASPAASASPKP